MQLDSASTTDPAAEAQTTDAVAEAQTTDAVARAEVVQTAVVKTLAADL